ncbi:MAG: KH domain-containing protein, partial [Minisyncoccales bacterium]
ILKSLADHPESVRVERKVDEMGVLLQAQVHPEDMGQVIGKKGATLRAIRDLARIVGIKNHARVTVKLIEPEGGRKTQS